MPRARITLRRAGLPVALAGALAGTAIGLTAAPSGATGPGRVRLTSSSRDAGTGKPLAASCSFGRLGPGGPPAPSGLPAPSAPSGPSGPPGPGRPLPVGAKGTVRVRIGVIGTVSDASPAGFTLTTLSGTRSVTTTGSTAYRELCGVQPSGVSNGEIVVVVSSSASPTPPSATSPIVASSVWVVGPQIAGKVVALSGGTATVEDAEGFYRTVDVSSATVTGRDGSTTLAVGDEVMALGSIASDHTTLDATEVVVLPKGRTLLPLLAPFAGPLPPPMALRISASAG